MPRLLQAKREETGERPGQRIARQTIGLGLDLLCIVPTIERQDVLFRAFWINARLGCVVSVAIVGSPSVLLVVFPIPKVIGAPVFIVWQDRVARSASITRDRAVID